MEDTEVLDNQTADKPGLETDSANGTTPPQVQPPPQPQQPGAPQGGSESDNAPDESGAGPAQDPQKPGFFHRVLNDAANILGGANTVVLSPQADGSVAVTRRESTPGEKWGRIAQAALGGAASALAQPPGPGQLARAASSSIQTGIAMPQQQHQQAQQEIDAGQRAQLHNAQMALLQTQNASAVFNLSRDKVKAMEGFAQAQNDMNELITQNPMNRMIGTVASSKDLPKLKKTDPNIIKGFYSDKVKLLTHVNDDGSYGGFDVYHIEPSWGDQLNQEPIRRRYMVGGDKIGDPPKIETVTLPANSIKNADFMKVHAADEQGIIQNSVTLQKQKDEESNQASEAQLRRAQSANQYAEAHKNNAEADAAGGGVEGGSQQQNAQMMVDGLSSPSQMSKRAKTYNALLPLANQYSMQKYGKPFDAEVSEGRFKARESTIKDFASGTQGDQIASFNTFLGHAENLSQTVNQLRNTNSPLLNVPLKSLRKAAGDARYATIDPQIQVVRREYENFLNNNRALHDQDIGEGKELLNDNMSLAQMQAAVKQFSTAALTRVGALNDRHKRVVGGDAPDLLNDTSRRTINDLGLAPYASQTLGTAWSGNPQPNNQQQRPAQPGQQPQRSPATHIFSPTAWKAANPNGDVNAAIAAAKAANYQVSN